MAIPLITRFKLVENRAIAIAGRDTWQENVPKDVIIIIRILFYKQDEENIFSDRLVYCIFINFYLENFLNFSVIAKPISINFLILFLFLTTICTDVRFGVSYLFLSDMARHCYCMLIYYFTEEGLK